MVEEFTYSGASDTMALGGSTFVVLAGTCASVAPVSTGLAGGITPECHRSWKKDVVAHPSLIMLLEVARPIRECIISG